MKIVVSPAKTMIENTDCYIGSSVPTYIDTVYLDMKILQG